MSLVGTGNTPFPCVFFVYLLHDKSEYLIMLFFESKSPEEKKIWVRKVLEKISRLHGYKRISSLDETYGFPQGTINTIVSRGTLKPVLDMAITCALSFNVCLDNLLLLKEDNSETQVLTPLIEEGLFKAYDLKLLEIKYPDISTAARIISDTVCNQQRAAC